ncbi:MAG: hypothetical protein ABSE86_35850 [Bryobacteraceae bacterium]|jgi:hypothetical protein
MPTKVVSFPEMAAAGGQVLDGTPQVPLANADGPVAAILEHIRERDFI